MAIERYDAKLSTCKRKQHGIFYTPVEVVRYLLQATAPSGPVADISCGDGAFLEEAARAGHMVMGIDQDADALACAQDSLSRIAEAKWHLHNGDGLQPDLPQVPDVVLGNPPYLEAKKTDASLKDHCKKLFPEITRGAFDIFICFLQAGLDLLPPGGRLGYIIPNKFFISDYARPLREHLLRETTIEQIIDVSDLPTFRDAAVYPVMLIIKKIPPTPGHCVRTGQVSDLAQLEQLSFPTAEIQQALWEKTSRSIFWLPPIDDTERVLVDRLLADERAHPLGEYLDIRWTISFHRTGLRELFIFPAPTGKFPRKLLGGKSFHGNADVRRYRTDWSGWWIDFDELRAKELKNQFPPAALFSGEKLLIAQNARRIIATLDRADYACKDTFLVGRSNIFSPPLPFILALLNSALLSFLYSVIFKATHVGGAYLHYLGCYLVDLPIRLPADYAPFCSIVERMLDEGTTETEREQLDTELDELIFELYDLNAIERALVRQTVPYSWGAAGGRKGVWRAEENL
ncbi:MAG: N-6 DNA methylase [bacterium]